MAAIVPTGSSPTQELVPLSKYEKKKKKLDERWKVVFKIFKENPNGCSEQVMSELTLVQWEKKVLAADEANKHKLFDIEKMDEYLAKAKEFAKNDEGLFNDIKAILENPEFQKKQRRFIINEKKKYPSDEYREVNYEGGVEPLWDTRDFLPRHFKFLEDNFMWER